MGWYRQCISHSHDLGFIEKFQYLAIEGEKIVVQLYDGCVTEVLHANDKSGVHTKMDRLAAWSVRIRTLIDLGSRGDARTLAILEKVEMSATKRNGVCQ